MVKTMSELTAGIFEQLKITDNTDMDQRVKYTDRILTRAEKVLHNCFGVQGDDENLLRIPVDAQTGKGREHGWFLGLAQGGWNQF